MFILDMISCCYHYLYCSLCVWVHSAVTQLYETQSSPFAPFLTNGAEVCLVTWRTIARNFRATTKARLSRLKEATRLAAADVRLAPLLAPRPGQNRRLRVNEYGSPVIVKRLNREFKPHFGPLAPFWGFWHQVVSPEGLQPWLVRIMRQRKVTS